MEIRETKVEGPWYTRSELWITLVTTLLGIFTTKSTDAQTVQTVGAAISGLAPLAYIWTRGKVKAAKAIPAKIIVEEIKKIDETSLPILLDHVKPLLIDQIKTVMAAQK